MTLITLLLPPLVACIVLTAIHTYLGLHVVTRGIIFIDIALAQLAALGLTFAVWLGFEVDSMAAYTIGLSVAVLGAFFFSFFRSQKIPQEAIIGVTFAVAQALSILLISKTPHGSEHLQYILNGSILWVHWDTIIYVAIIYACLGGIHYWANKKLWLISKNAPQAKAQGIKLWKWDLLFYVTFAVIITSSVQIAGILVVFSFLIVPAIVGILFCQKLRGQLITGWSVGILASLLGLGSSYAWDFPTGASIVSALGMVLLLTFIVYKRIKSFSVKYRLINQSTKQP